MTKNEFANKTRITIDEADEILDFFTANFNIKDYGRVANILAEACFNDSKKKYLTPNDIRISLCVPLNEGFEIINVLPAIRDIVNLAKKGIRGEEAGKIMTDAFYEQSKKPKIHIQKNKLLTIKN